MKWRVEHVLAATVDELERVVLAPETVALQPEYMPLIRSAEVLERRDEAGVLTRRTHFRPRVTPPSFARGVTPEMLEWVEHLRWDRAAHSGEFRIEPQVPAEWRRYFSGSGVYRLEVRDAQHTARVIESDLTIRVPLVGPIAERYAISQLKTQFDGEARLLTRLVLETR